MLGWLPNIAFDVEFCHVHVKIPSVSKRKGLEQVKAKSVKTKNKITKQIQKIEEKEVSTF